MDGGGNYAQAANLAGSYARLPVWLRPLY